MPLSFEAEGADKDQMVTSLAVLLLRDSGVDVTADAINGIINASGNKVPSYYATLFASFVEKAGDLSKMMPAPAAGGGMF